MDWNLIPTLEALLSERSVSRAARRLGLSQPAVSNALARLRRQYGDELLVRKGSTYILTPLAEQLLGATRHAVEAVSTVAASSSTFDPAASDRKFTVVASDYIQTALGASLLEGLRRHAPLARVAFVAPFGDRFRNDEEMLEETDGWIAPREMLPGRDHIGSVEDRWVCVVALDHPGIGRTLTLQDVERYPWVAPTIRGKALRLHLDGLAAHGIEPRVDVTTDSFGAIPFLIAASDRIGILQESMARRLAAAAGVRILECPWAVQPLHLTFWWSAKRESDAGHAWFREVVRDCLGAFQLQSDTWSQASDDRT